MSIGVYIDLDYTLVDLGAPVEETRLHSQRVRKVDAHPPIIVPDENVS